MPGKGLNGADVAGSLKDEMKPAVGRAQGRGLAGAWLGGRDAPARSGLGKPSAQEGGERWADWSDAAGLAEKQDGRGESAGSAAEAMEVFSPGTMSSC